MPDASPDVTTLLSAWRGDGRELYFVAGGDGARPAMSFPRW